MLPECSRVSTTVASPAAANSPTDSVVTSPDSVSSEERSLPDTSVPTLPPRSLRTFHPARSPSSHSSPPPATMDGPATSEPLVAACAGAATSSSAVASRIPGRADMG